MPKTSKPGPKRAARPASTAARKRTRAAAPTPAKKPAASTAARAAATGKASDAKAADGDAPVFAYIATLSPAHRAIAERIDALAAKAVPGLRRGVKWGMAYYGVDGGWCFSAGAFADHVKLMFIRGTELTPVPPVTPIAMGKQTRGVELTSLAALDARQVTAWMKHAATIPFATAAQRRAAAAVSTRG